MFIVDISKTKICVFVRVLLLLVLLSVSSRSRRNIYHSSLALVTLFFRHRTLIPRVFLQVYSYFSK